MLGHSSSRAGSLPGASYLAATRLPRPARRAASGPRPQIHPGQSTLAFYTAQNLSDKAITGVSTYNVTPQQAGTYFNKIQCFCFEVGAPAGAGRGGRGGPWQRGGAWEKAGRGEGGLLAW